MELRLKIATVTGASSGLGAAILQALIDEEVLFVFGIARTAVALKSLQKNQAIALLHYIGYLSTGQSKKPDQKNVF